MNRFQYVKASDLPTATALLQQPETAAMAGGTDLLPEIKRGIRTPQKLVSIKPLAEPNGIQFETGKTMVDALTTIGKLEEHPQIANQLPLLRDAAVTVGSPQIRNMGTVGGNLNQSVRCWYYRHPQIQCWLKGGNTCYARLGLNRHHAIFGRCPCVAVNPSDLAPALVALNATVQIVHPTGTREISLESLYQLPDTDRRRQTTLPPGELIAGIAIPKTADHCKGIYLKAMERATWSFALVSVAAQIEFDGDRVRQASIVLGGVAGIPWRVRHAEKLLLGRVINESLAEEAAEESASGSNPLEGNVYKIAMIKTLLKRALLELT